MTPFSRARTGLLRVGTAAALLAVSLAPSAGAAAPLSAQPLPLRALALATSGPSLHEPTASLAAALSCVGDVAGSPHTPILLLHGTGSTPQESWTVYQPLLAAAGYPVCTVALPNRATRDMQISTEYVVYAIRTLAARRNGRIDVVGHSQGATLPIVALKFWPDLAGDIEDYVGLAPTFHTPATGEAQCVNSCSAPFQQRRANSVWFANFERHPLPAGPSYTTISTRTDEVVVPEPQGSHLDGASNVVLQDSCPVKAVDHFGLITDGSVWALALDAITGPGPTDASRVPVTTCLDTYPAGVDPVVEAPLQVDAVARDLDANSSAVKLAAEPTVRCYLLASCLDVQDRGRLLTGAKLSGAALSGGQLQLQTQAPGTVAVQVLRGTVVVRTVSVPVTVGTTTVDLAAVAGGADRVALLTTTDWYTGPAQELSLTW